MCLRNLTTKEKYQPLKFINIFLLMQINKHNRIEYRVLIIQQKNRYKKYRCGSVNVQMREEKWQPQR